jgi:hypothetical protein
MTERSPSPLPLRDAASTGPWPLHHSHDHSHGDSHASTVLTSPRTDTSIAPTKLAAPQASPGQLLCPLSSVLKQRQVFSSATAMSPNGFSVSGPSGN